MSPDEKSCTRCGETIKAEAAKCRFCGEWLTVAVGSESVAAPEIHELLLSLVDRSMAVKDEETGRFYLLETVRKYAEEHLYRGGEAARLRSRHVDHFLTLAEEAGRRLQESDQAAWLSRLETEHDNLRSALAWLLAAPAPVSSTAARLCVALEKFWQRRGHLGEARAYLQATVERSGDALPPLERGQLFGSLGWFAYLQGDYETAKQFYRTSLRTFTQMDDLLGRSNALNNLGLVAQAEGDMEAARRLFEGSLALATELRDGPRRAARLSNLGLLHAQASRLTEANESLQSALEIYRLMGDSYGEAACLCNLGELALETAKFEEAETALREAVRLMEEGGDHSGLAYPLVNLVETAIARGALEEAERLAREAFALCAEMELRALVPTLLESWARIRLPAGYSEPEGPIEAEEALAAAEALRAVLHLPRSGREAAHVDSLMTALDPERLRAARERLENDYPADPAVLMARELGQG